MHSDNYERELFLESIWGRPVLFFQLKGFCGPIIIFVLNGRIFLVGIEISTGIFQLYKLQPSGKT